MSIYKEIESQIQEVILKDGVVYINVWSTDCDGFSSSGSREFKTMDDYYQWDEDFWEWQEGSQGYEIATKETQNEYASCGNGVDGWEDMFNY